MRRLSILLMFLVAAVPAAAAAWPEVGDEAPQALVGTWQRTVTKADVRRGPRDSGFVTPGAWRLRIAAAGTVFLSDSPRGPAITVGTVQRVRAGVLAIRFVDRGGGECTDVGTYAWRRSLRALRLVKLRDPCQERAVVLVGRWRKL